MAEIIGRFWQEHEFLSNFFPSPIMWDGREWPTLEHAYQAAKTLDLSEQEEVRKARTPGESKRLGRRVTIRDDWEEAKIGVMEELLRLKFSDPDLQERLLATGDAELVEGNNWRDRFWGVTQDKDGSWTGQNWLGRLLMKIREELRD
jgi:ribA/ribD-fused uncharacterized protein